MIQFQTSRFGAMEVAEDKIIHFPDGLIGLPEMKRFVLIDHKDTPVKWLQSLDSPDIAFIVTSPEMIAADFSLDLDRRVRERIQLGDDDDLVILVILRVHGEDVIANFQGPLLVNARDMIGVQIVMERPVAHAVIA